MIGGRTFTYGGKNSADYGLFFAYIDSDMTNVDVEKNASYEITSSKTRSSFHIVGRKHEDPLEREIEIISEKEITPSEEREIVRWLFDSPKYMRLTLNPFDYEQTFEYNGVFYNCYFTEERKLEFSDGVHGWSARIICDAPYGWSTVGNTSATVNGSDTLNIINDSDDLTPSIPYHVTIECSSFGDIILQNTSNNDLVTKFSDVSPDEVIEIDQYGQISTNMSNGIYERFNGKLPKLISGTNQITASGNFKITISFRNPRRVAL